MKINIFQAESTNYCNAKCSYCPHSKMTRPKGKMSIGTFRQVLKVINNDYLCLHHFGEPMLNENLPQFIREAKLAGVKIEFSTNGSVRGMLKSIMDAEPYMIRYAYDSFHDLEFLKEMVFLNKSTIIRGHSINEGTKPFTNYAGAVEGESQVRGECYQKIYGFVSVLWDGRIVPCCCDYDGIEVLGTIWDDTEIMLHSHYSLCKKCSGMQFTDGGLWL